MCERTERIREFKQGNIRTLVVNLDSTRIALMQEVWGTCKNHLEVNDLKSTAMKRAIRRKERGEQQLVFTFSENAERVRAQLNGTIL